MIKLHTFGPAFGLPDPSPFVTKVALYMKMANIEFEPIEGVSNLRSAPKLKLPFINDNGKIIADSVFIIDYLKQQYKADLDDWLSPEQAAIAQLIGKSLDENLYWTIVHSRWIKDDVWPTIEKQFFSDLPFPLNKVIAYSARSSTRKQIIGHGIGKHSDDEILDVAQKSLFSLSTLLADKDFFFGDKPCSLDITAYAMTSGLILSTLDTPMNQKALQFENLVEFVKRITRDHYPELL